MTVENIVLLFPAVAGSSLCSTFRKAEDFSFPRGSDIEWSGPELPQEKFSFVGYYWHWSKSQCYCSALEDTEHRN